jgi:hypothetical protein
VAGYVGLRDYLDRSPVFLGLFRGLYCAFCRRAVAGLGRLSAKLVTLGIQTLGVVATPTDHAGLYFRYHRINPTRELAEPLPVWEANKALGRLDLFRPSQTDRDDMERQWDQLAGLFLIDRTGIIRWVFVEATDGPAGIGKYPPEAEIVVLAQTLLQ